MSEPTIEMPALGAEGEQCRQCQAPLAVDQRYCLNCGQRRTDEGKVDFDRYLLGPAPGTAPVQGATAPAAPAAGNAWTPLSIVGSVAALGVMLLLGVMIGRDDSQVQVAAAPTEAPVASSETGAPAAAGGGSEKVSDTATGKGAGAGDKKGGDGGGGAGGGGNDDYVPVSEAKGATEVSDDALEALENTSGDDYAKQSKNLPDTIALPGEPPPTDNKEPGGGSKAVTIGG